jgi:hypothetical protein
MNTSTEAAKAATRQINVLAALGRTLIELAEIEAASLNPNEKNWGIAGSLNALNSNLANLIAAHDERHAAMFERDESGAVAAILAAAAKAA